MPQGPEENARALDSGSLQDGLLPGFAHGDGEDQDTEHRLGDDVGDGVADLHGTTTTRATR